MRSKKPHKMQQSRSHQGLISQEIDNFYEQASEEQRLTFGLGPLEFERNKELIQRSLPSDGGTVADVGGGPGLYAEWLAGLGHRVFLVDPVMKHIRQAEKRAMKLKGRLTCILGEARRLDLPDASADVVILHGPLYHLQGRDDRIACINEASRVLKPGGTVLGFAINRTASSLAGLQNGLIHQKSFFEMCLTELSSGIHQPPGNIPGLLPEAYFHRPAGLRSEFEEAGLSVKGLFAVEGMIWMDSSYFESRTNPEKKQTMTNLLRLTETDEDLLCLSPHMMIAAEKR